uniref:Calcium-binding protein 39 n=1 Tax=Noctiluca scintillans TaxID=2966 RepID=A0A7S1F5C1_NOCSC
MEGRSDLSKVVQRVSANLELFGLPAGTIPKNADTLQEAFQVDLGVVLEALREITGEDRPRLPDERYKAKEVSAADAENFVDELLGLDLPAKLLAKVPLLEHESLNAVTNIVSTLLRHDLPPTMKKHATQYVCEHRHFVELVMGGMAEEHLAYHKGAILRSCSRRREVTKVFLANGAADDLLKVILKADAALAYDAFGGLRHLLLECVAESAEWLEVNFENFFKTYHRIVMTTDYVLKRMALSLLSSLLGQHRFMKVSYRYATTEAYLKLVMNLLRDSSNAVRVEAFHVFKVFVGADTPANIRQILMRNRVKLIELLESMRAVSKRESKSAEHMAVVIGRLRQLQ